MGVLAVAKVAQLWQVEHAAAAAASVVAGRRTDELAAARLDSAQRDRNRGVVRRRVRKGLAGQVETKGRRSARRARPAPRAPPGSRPDRPRRGRRGSSLPRPGRGWDRRCRSARSAPRTARRARAAVLTNGYRLTTTRSTRPMPCARAASRSSGWSRRARMPAVNQRVEGLHAAVHHLGKAGDVGDAGDRQGPPRPARLAVPPVETSSNRRRASSAPRAARPVLSDTLKSARGMDGSKARF